MRRNPKDFGTIGAGDDTVAVNDALAAIRTDGGGILEMDGRAYDVGPLNATSCKRMKIQCEPSTIVRGSLMTTPAPILDLSGAPEVDIENGHWYGGLGDPWGNPPAPAVHPSTAILIAGGIDKVRMVSVRATGFFGSGCVSIISCVSVTLDHCQLLQREPVQPTGMVPPSLVMSSNPGEWGIASIFAPQMVNLGYVNDINVMSSEVHSVGSPGQLGWTTYMRNASHITFVAGHHSGMHEAYMLFQGLCDTVTTVGHKYYAESGNSELDLRPNHVFQIWQVGQCNNLRVYNPWPSNLQGACKQAPLAVADGGFPGYTQG